MVRGGCRAPTNGSKSQIVYMNGSIWIGAVSCWLDHQVCDVNLFLLFHDVTPSQGRGGVNTNNILQKIERRLSST